MPINYASGKGEMSEDPISPVISPRSGRRQITSVGNYTLLKTVGQGQFGKVKLGVHMITKEKVRRWFILNEYFINIYLGCY